MGSSFKRMALLCTMSLLESGKIKSPFDLLYTTGISFKALMNNGRSKESNLTSGHGDVGRLRFRLIAFQTLAFPALLSIVLVGFS